MIQNIQSPRQLLIGGGTVSRVAEVLAGLGLSRPLVVTDPWMVSSGTVEKLLAPLAAAGIRPAVFHETVPDPTDTVVMAGAAAFRAGDFDCLVGFGGGSPMDTAKAIALMAHPEAPAHIRALKVPHAANTAAAPVNIAHRRFEALDALRELLEQFGLQEALAHRYPALPPSE